jgi:hypothetical protein
LIDVLFANGYNVNMRKWAYWNVTNKSFLSLLDTVDKKEYECLGMNENMVVYNRIIQEVLNKYIIDETDLMDDNSIEISSNLNLGLISPFEV